MPADHFKTGSAWLSQVLVELQGQMIVQDLHAPLYTMELCGMSRAVARESFYFILRNTLKFEKCCSKDMQ